MNSSIFCFVNISIKIKPCLLLNSSCTIIVSAGTTGPVSYQYDLWSYLEWRRDYIFIVNEMAYLISLEFLYRLLEQLSILYSYGTERQVPLEYLHRSKQVQLYFWIPVILRQKKKQSKKIAKKIKYNKTSSMKICLDNKSHTICLIELYIFIHTHMHRCANACTPVKRRFEILRRN